MAARSIASLTLSFGLVSIPVKLYSATQASGADACSASCSSVTDTDGSSLTTRAAGSAASRRL